MGQDRSEFRPGERVSGFLDVASEPPAARCGIRRQDLVDGDGAGEDEAQHLQRVP